MISENHTQIKVVVAGFKVDLFLWGSQKPLSKGHMHTPHFVVYGACHSKVPTKTSSTNSKNNFNWFQKSRCFHFNFISFCFFISNNILTGPKPLKRFTPPPPGENNHQGDTSSEEYSSEEYEEDSEDERRRVYLEARERDEALKQVTSVTLQLYFLFFNDPGENTELSLCFIFIVHVRDS